jgi:peptidoglycan/LPS O-acetylase OafA/YrhL
MFQNYLGVKSVDGVYWTLAIELSFYFWIGLALWTNQISKAVYIFTSICFVSVFTANSSYFELKIFNVLFFTYYLPFFVIGMAAYLIQSKLNLKQGYIGVLISILTLYLTRESGVFIASLICLGIFFSAILLDFKLFSSPVLRFLGLISYPLYLLHQNIGYITINLLKSYLFAEVLAVLVAILISVSLAWVTHIYVENKLTSNIRNRVGKVGWFSK